MPSATCPTCTTSTLTCPNPNEEHTDFGRDCNEKCDTVCTAADWFHRKGCFCKAGYKRINGVCQLASLCSSTTCGQNQMWTCANDCEDKCDSGCVKNPATCVSRCACIPGFKLINGLCQNERLCPNIPNPTVCTGPNEINGTCAAKCDEPCTIEKFCSIPPGCTAACVCAAGFRRINGVCVAQSQCETQCRENQSFRMGSECEESCPVPGTTCSKEQKLSCHCKPNMIKILNECRTFDCRSNVEV